MKFATASMVLLATICVSSAQWPAAFGGGFGGPGAGGPPASPGWLIGQGASINAVSLAVNGALAANSDGSTLPPELQVIHFIYQSQLSAIESMMCDISFLFIRLQQELQKILDDSSIALSACDDLLLTSTVWRYKICKFQELTKIKARLLELKLKAAAAAAASVPSEPEQSEPATQTVPPTTA